MVITTISYSFGTGTNGAFVDDVAKITKLGNSISTVGGSKMVINTEWGAFDNQVNTVMDNVTYSQRFLISYFL